MRRAGSSIRWRSPSSMTSWITGCPGRCGVRRTEHVRLYPAGEKDAYADRCERFAVLDASGQLVCVLGGAHLRWTSGAWAGPGSASRPHPYQPARSNSTGAPSRPQPSPVPNCVMLVVRRDPDGLNPTGSSCSLLRPTRPSALRSHAPAPARPVLRADEARSQTRSERFVRFRTAEILIPGGRRTRVRADEAPIPSQDAVAAHGRPPGNQVMRSRISLTSCPRRLQDVRNRFREMRAAGSSTWHLHRGWPRRRQRFPEGRPNVLRGSMD